MTDNQENKLSSYEATNGILHSDANQPIWSTVPEFAAFVATFLVLLTDIRDIRQIQERDTTGKALDKAEIQDDLIDAMLKVINAVVAHAIITEDKDLEKSVNYTLADLMNSRDNILADRARLIYSIAWPLKANLTRFKVLEADITRVDTLNKQFLESISSPRESKVISKTATSDLKAKFKEVDDLLHNKMDKIVLIFRPDHPGFVQQYFNSRIIIDLGHRKSGTKYAVFNGKAVHFETLLPLAGVTVRDLETGQSAITDAQGNYSLSYGKAGTYTFRAEMDGFHIATKDPIAIQLGNSLRLDDFELEPIDL
jgi:hypothetical protein